MAGVGSTSKVTSTFNYKVKLIYDEGLPGETELVLSEMLFDDPPKIVHNWVNTTTLPPNASTGIYSGKQKQMVNISFALWLKSDDERDMELQEREIIAFFEDAPSNAATVYYVDEGATQAGKVFSCRLLDINADRLVGEQGYNGDAVIRVVLESTQTTISYTESGDPAPTVPTLYGSMRHRVQTDNGSTAWSIVNDVTADTLLVLTDKGKLHVRGSVIQESESL